MNVIVFASRKGGSGKSTLAAHLAAHVHKATKPMPAGRCRSAGVADALAQAARHQRTADQDRRQFRQRDHRRRQARRRRMGVHRHAAELSAVVDDAIRNATMVIIPARPGVFDVNAVQETIQTCRAARKPYAVVINGAPAERDERRKPHRHHRARSAGQVPRAGVERPDHQPRRSADGAQPWRRRPRILCGRPRGGRDRPAVGARSNARSRRSAARRRHPARCTSRRRNNAAMSRTDKDARAPRVFLLCDCLSSPGWAKDRSSAMTVRLTPPSACRTRRPATGQDHRPDAERPQNVLGGKALLFREWYLSSRIHDAPPRFLLLWGY